jgi:hypothetical protein
MGTHRLHSHFLRPSPTRSRDVSGDGQSVLVVKLRVSPSRSRLLTGPHRYQPGIVQQAQGRSYETAVSPHHNKLSAIYCTVYCLNSLPLCNVSARTIDLDLEWDLICNVNATVKLRTGHMVLTMIDTQYDRVRNLCHRHKRTNWSTEIVVFVSR